MTNEQIDIPPTLDPDRVKITAKELIELLQNVEPDKIITLYVDGSIYDIDQEATLDNTNPEEEFALFASDE